MKPLDLSEATSNQDHEEWTSKLTDEPAVVTAIDVGAFDKQGVVVGNDATALRKTLFFFCFFGKR